MKKVFAPAALLLLSLYASPSQAQEEKVVERKVEKEIETEFEEVIIRRKGDKDSKVTIEIKDGKVTVNGKPVEEYDDENVSVRARRSPRVFMTAPGSRFRTFGAEGLPAEGLYEFETMAPLARVSNKALLGVTTEIENGGATILTIGEKSAAEKAGLKVGDVITKINEDAISSQETLTKAIGKYKPEDKVVVTYKRAGKLAKTTATLGKNIPTTTFSRSYGFGPSQGGGRELEGLGPLENYSFDFNFPRMENGFYLAGKPRLGIKAQDTDEGKGVKVLEVSKESQAEKAGIRVGDLITSFDGKTVNSTEQLIEAATESREKAKVNVEILRDGKSQTLEIKTPKKLKTANL